jgi:stage II sporulation protein D
MQLLEFFCASEPASPGASISFFSASGPGLGRPPSPSTLLDPDRREVRVLLGRFRSFSITGSDLLLNGVTRVEGEAVFNLRCTRRNGLAVVSYGSGESSGRLEILAPGGFLHVNGKLYRNRVTVLAKEGECAVVNVVDLEKYLAGLINKEMSPSWPLEAMKAQAVASRSYALFQARANRSREFDLESTTQDQVYDGASSESPKSNRAAEETRGQVITFAEAPLKAYFHANCGGKTELPSAVWGGNSGIFRPVNCPYHRRPRDRLRWSLVLSGEQIDAALRKVGGVLPSTVFRVAKLEAGTPNQNRRLNEVVVSDSHGNSFSVPANVFRNAVGNTRIRSTSFRIQEEAGKYRLSGEGFGHGVGMCQVGARAMAEEGKTYRQILEYYYPLAKLIRL